LAWGHSNENDFVHERVDNKKLFLFQVARPITLKKDGIQTRNRKLAAKAKKRRHGLMHDFLRPLDSNPFSAAYQQAMGGSASYLGTGPMSQYYGSNFGPMSQMGSQFMPSASSMGYHPAHAHHAGAGNGSPFSFGSSTTSHMANMSNSLVAMA
jgi:hypothetical protein